MKAILKIDLNHRFDSTTMHGVATRSGKFVYIDGVRFKDWDNIKTVFNLTDHLPVIGSTGNDSHLDIDDRMIGFAWNFTPNEETEEMEFDLEYFKDIKELSDLEDPNDLPVSIGFRDLALSGSGTRQIIDKVHHIAVSLNKTEKDRCSASGGTACTVSMKTDSMNSERSSSLETEDLVKLKKKKGDSKMAKQKKEKEEKITEDAVATPDNVGKTTDPKQNAKSAKASFMLDCQKNGPYPAAQCEKAWTALTKPDTTAPKKSGDDTKSTTEEVKGKSKDMVELEVKVDKFEKIFNDLADIIPTLSAVVKDKNNANAMKMVEMKNELEDAGYCKDMLSKIIDFNELSIFYQRVRTNNSNFTEPTSTEIQNINTSRLLGKRKKETTDFEDMMNTAKNDALSKLYPKGIPAYLGGTS